MNYDDWMNQWLWYFGESYWYREINQEALCELVRLWEASRNER